MADTADTQAQRPEPEANTETVPVPSTLDLTLFSTDEAARLADLRDLILQGRVNEETADPMRLLFARWLYEHGKIKG